MPGNELLDDAVLQGVKADHDQPGTGCQDIQTSGQGFFQLVEFPVDENPQSLKGAGCRVLTGLAGFHRVCHELGQLAGAGQRAAGLAARHDRPGNRASKALLAVVTDDLRDVVGFGQRQPLRHTLAARGVHAHVQRPVEAKTKAPRRVVDLR